MPDRNVVCYDVEGNTGGGWDDEASNPTKQRRVCSCVRIVEPRLVLSSFVKGAERVSLRFVGKVRGNNAPGKKRRVAVDVVVQEERAASFLVM